jgi:hypothetical protein
MTTTRISNKRTLTALTPNERERRRRSLRVISSMRENPALGLTEAALQEGVSPKSVLRYGGEGLQKDRGRWRTKPADRIYRPMFVYSDGDKVAVDVRGSRKASELGAYHAAVGEFLATGEESVLSRFEGRTVGGHTYETDPTSLEEMARRGQLDMDSIYQPVA